MEKKYFLHELLKNTNLQMPAIGYIDSNIFPEQDTENINSVQSITFIKQGYRETDYDPESRDPIEHGTRHFTKDFTCIRSDIFDSEYENAKEIYLSRDCKDIIIFDKKQNNTIYSALEAEGHLIGLQVYPEYRDRGISREAYVFSIQGLENGFATIIEYLDDDTYRIITDTELYFTYNPDDIYIPVEEPDVSEIRKRLIEGRVAFRGENNVGQ